jgi:hypothetical protein
VEILAETKKHNKRWKYTYIYIYRERERERERERTLCCLFGDLQVGKRIYQDRVRESKD